jgi:TonB family protein
LSQRGLSADPNAQAGFVLVRFDLDPSGHTRNVQVLESDPVGFKDEAVARHVRLSRFRPHMENGVPILARNLALQITFRYLDNEPP